ncbi:hypothetical protein PAESOLCIP111_06717 [Paenibacillus solanacearum]|uniref:DUF4145 domain-containing protein n=2 Tax=Paenibacillus solanacearum TaxID=2048548 RepID=A0A916KB50_9BACL|nr:hypothetical protein PAESOLCIP111_06717 [Paenibacillus solanacearum]
MTNRDKLKTFLLNNVEIMEHDGGAGTSIKYPSFELTSRDFLEFAEIELSKLDNAGLINCVSHIKRAMDCQLDSFLYAYNLYKPFKDRKLGIDKKLDFLNEAGVFSSRSLSRLNIIRNKMEHEYEVPKIQDIEIYFDLVSAFVSILERHILILDVYGSSNYRWNNTHNGRISRFSIYYNLAVPRIEIEWETQEDGEVEISAEITDINEFSYFLRVFFLLSQFYVHSSKRYIITQLQK